jgi:predicted RNA-binding Zn-ribbon protein involved in translation (DUF1610 family)
VRVNKRVLDSLTYDVDAVGCPLCGDVVRRNTDYQLGKSEWTRTYTCTRCGTQVKSLVADYPSLPPLKCKPVSVSLKEYEREE